jgi:hypothetical protein
VKTDSLIDQLANGLAPVRPGHVARLLIPALLGSMIVAVILMSFWLGVRPDLGSAMQTSALWMKLSYTLSYALLGFWLVDRLGRPGVRAAMPMRLLAVPLIVIALLAIAQLSAPSADTRQLVMGGSAKVCAFHIIVISLPVFVAAFWAMRRLAPTNLTWAGAAAGLLAGGAGAFVYAFRCTETAAPFVAIWYTLGIAAASAAGAILGRWVLRW